MRNNKQIVEYHSCYDQLLSKLFLLSYDNKEHIEDTEAVSKDRDSYVSLISDGIRLTDGGVLGKSITPVSIKYDSNGNGIIDKYDNDYDLTAHEIIIYSLLLHKCIENQSEEQEISYSELQRLRHKRIGKTKVLDDATKQAYNNAFQGLGKKRIKYSLDTKKRSKKITYGEGEHPLLIIRNVSCLENGDKIIKYSLGRFGKTLIEAKQYSTLVPAEYFKINFNEVMTYQIALYVCRILFIQKQPRKKQKQPEFTIKLTSIMKNTSKFINSEKYGIVKYGCSLYYYNGENTKRYWESTIKKVNELLETLKHEYKIKDYKFIYETIETAYGIKYDYQNVKWIIQI